MLQLLPQVYTEKTCWIHLVDNMRHKHLRIIQQNRHLRTTTVPQKFLFFHDEMPLLKKKKKVK